MDYKKKYEESLERGSRLWESGSITLEDYKYMFPEHKESEDEKIMKEIILFLKEGTPYYCSNSVRRQEWATWLEKQGKNEEINEASYRAGIKRVLDNPESYGLEKQGEQNLTRPVWKYKKDHTPLLRDSFILNKYGCVGKSPSGALVSDVWVLDFDELAKLPKEEFEGQSEQKSIDKVKPKFKVGDWVVWNGHIISHIDNIYEENTLMYTINTNGVTWTDSVKKFDAIAHIWTIQDAKKGDILQANKCTLIFDSLAKDIDGNTVISSWYSCDTHTFYGMGPSQPDLWVIEGVVPATKEQRDFLFQKMKEARYEWDAEKKELKKIEQKPAWSEEDNIEISVLINALGELETYGGDFSKQKIWLNSLKERIQPQPKQKWNEEDEEMIEGLNNCLDELEEANGWRFTYINNKDVELCEVRNWLKSIKERVRPQSKQEWSEEDEEMFDAIIADIQFTQKAHTHDVNQVVYEREIDWLKSLKERYNWKPSEGQLECLGYAIEKAEKDWTPLTNNRIYLTLKALKEQLEKL